MSGIIRWQVYLRADQALRASRRGGWARYWGECPDGVSVLCLPDRRGNGLSQSTPFKVNHFWAVRGSREDPLPARWDV